MRAEPDTFARFLEAVVAGLDEPPGGAMLASRIHVSRSQLDRLVAAAAGEPPGQLRRRLLLERAAYRLLDGDLRILDVAIEAGYTSHEAFARAFRRAYGAPPSAWRVAAGVSWLHAPNDVHFHPPGGLRVPGRSEVTSMDLVVSMTEHHVWLVGQMLDRASRLDDARLDAPISAGVDAARAQPTARALLSRLVGQMDMWNQAVANRPYDFAVEEREPVDSMRRRLDACGLVFLGHVREACQRGALADTFVDATSGTPMFFTYAGMIAHVLTYAAYRRTLVSQFLAEAGITDLEDDPLAWEPVRPAGPSMP